MAKPWAVVYLVFYLLQITKITVNRNLHSEFCILNSALNWQIKPTQSVNKLVILALNILCCINATAKVDHTAVNVGKALGTQAKLVAYGIGVWNLLFILHLMLKARPIIHRNGAYLHLDLHVLPGVREKDGDGQNQMQTAISVWLRILDIILSRDKGDVILVKQCVGNKVDIVNVGADNPNPCNIVNILPDAVKTYGNFTAKKLLKDALGPFQAGGNGAYGIRLVR